MTVILPVFTKERNDWKGLKPTKPKKYPEELYEFHPTGELNNPVSKIIRKSTTRNINKTNLDNKKDVVVLDRVNPPVKLSERTTVNVDNFPSLFEFFHHEPSQQLERSGRQDSNQTKLNSEYLAVKTIQPVFVPANNKKKQIIRKSEKKGEEGKERDLIKKSNQLRPDLLALKIVKPQLLRRQEAEQKQRRIEHLKVPGRLGGQGGPGEKSLETKIKKSSVERKPIKFNNAGVVRPSGYRNREIKATKTKLRKSKIYQKNPSHPLLSINRLGTRSETKAEFSQGTHNRHNNAGQKSNSLNRRKGFVSSRKTGEIPTRRHIDSIQIQNIQQSTEESEAVFEFESTISVSLDSGGYLMTIILVREGFI